MAITLFLIPEQTGWKVQGFWLNVSTLGNKDSFQLLEAARKQEQQGHNFNATVLLAAAGQLSGRGLNFQLALTDTIAQEFARLGRPAELSGEAPFLWRNGDVTWKVLNVGAIAIGGKIYLMISHEVGPIQTEDQVDGWNKQLLTYFKGRNPEYADIFDGLVASANERGTTREFRTIDEVIAPK